MDSHDILISPGILCYCGKRLRTWEDWNQHSAQADEQGLSGHHGYSTDDEVGLVYNLTPGYYQCSSCGEIKYYQEIDENEWEQVDYYICSCGQYYYSLEDRSLHLKVFKCESYTKATGYKSISE